MGLAVRLRRDYSTVDLRGLARRSGDAALAGGVGLQTVRAFGFAVQRMRP